MKKGGSLSVRKVFAPAKIIPAWGDKFLAIVEGDEY